VATTFLEAGFNVVCDKPVTFDLKEALTLRDLVQQCGEVFALAQLYRLSDGKGST
jgi:predicted dehydrogenase